MKYNQKMAQLKKKLEEKSEEIKAILTDYQTLNVSEYEIERCIRTIDGLHENEHYLNAGCKIDSSAVMLPSNLPLYSLFVFAVIPSILSHSVYVRPNSLLQDKDIISRLYKVLELDTLFPEVTIVNEDHAGFKKHINEASLIVFTGNPSHAETFVKEMKKNSLLVINGAGHNPLVITESADINKAVEDAVMVKGFNGGQDCAGPDAILVHQAVAAEFIEKFSEKFSNLKTGSFQDPDTVIGPILRGSELQRIGNILLQNAEHICKGGSIDFKHKVIAPAVIIRNIEDKPNYQEVFGPIAFIHPYKCDDHLSLYFESEDGEYKKQRMYATVYGKSEYVSARDDRKTPGKPGNIGIVLENETIHHAEIGYKPYGGYSMGASGLIKKTSKSKVQRVAMPILLPEIMVKYLIDDKQLPTFSKERSSNVLPLSAIKKGNEIIPIIEEFKAIALEVFGDNLLFGFVFGSAAKEKLIVTGKDRDDLDTFICLKEPNPAAIKKYNKRLAKLHAKHKLKVDETFPSEIMTLAALKDAISAVKDLDVSINIPIQGEAYDHLFWAHALSDKKTGFIGDGKTMSSLIKIAMPNIQRWRKQIMEQIEQSDVLPEYFSQRFAGLGKGEILDKLSQYSDHLVVHLGLDYVNKNSLDIQVEKQPTSPLNSPRFFDNGSYVPIAKDHSLQLTQKNSPVQQQKFGY